MEQHTGHHPKGGLLAWQENIRLGQKGLALIKALAYYATVFINGHM